MSLMRLLTAGKSLVGLKELNGRYHLPNQRALPRFEAKKNMFRQPTATVSVAASGQECPRSESPASTEPVSQELNHAAIGAEPENRTTVENPKTAATGKPWMSRVLGLFKSAEPKPARPTTSAPARGKGLVQGELSLESVKVVRNDLRDSDLEVVTARTTQPPPPPTAKAADGGAGEEPGALTELVAAEPTGRSEAPKITPPERLKFAANALAGRWFGGRKQ